MCVLRVLCDDDASSARMVRYQYIGNIVILGSSQFNMANIPHPHTHTQGDNQKYTLFKNMMKSRYEIIFVFPMLYFLNFETSNNTLSSAIVLALLSLVLHCCKLFEMICILALVGQSESKGEWSWDNGAGDWCRNYSMIGRH